MRALLCSVRPAAQLGCKVFTRPLTRAWRSQSIRCFTETVNDHRFANYDIFYNFIDRELGSDVVPRVTNDGEKITLGMTLNKLIAASVENTTVIKGVSPERACTLVCDLVDEMPDDFQKFFLTYYIDSKRDQHRAFLTKSVLRYHDQGLAWLLDVRAILLQHLNTFGGDGDTTRLEKTQTVLKEAIAPFAGKAATSLYLLDPEAHKEMIEQLGRLDRVHPTEEGMANRCGPNNLIFVIASPVLGVTRPIVFVALDMSNKVPSNMSEILTEGKKSPAKPTLIEEPTVATFWSINTLEPGAEGLGVAANLIKSTLEVIKSKYPKVDKFVTLSPVPRLRDYIFRLDVKMFDQLATEAEQDAMVEYLGADKTIRPLVTLRDAVEAGKLQSDAKFREVMRPILTRFLEDHLSETPKNNLFKCPVSAFHTANGAKLLNVHWNADMSEERLSSSFGIMVNYEYEGKKDDTN
mmetsp:Transcript_19544/g.34820  ORF Transcript_19544/g.34820 Transcript_19544/m.34820 type:complete len:464 (-) Transcript_19544:127-1518(-)